MARGAEFQFDTAVVDLIVAEPRLGERKVAGVRLADGRELPCSSLLLAAGHSARLLYERLLSHGVALQPKPIGTVRLGWGQGQG